MKDILGVLKAVKTFMHVGKFNQKTPEINQKRRRLEVFMYEPLYIIELYQ